MKKEEFLKKEKAMLAPITAAYIMTEVKSIIGFISITPAKIREWVWNGDEEELETFLRRNCISQKTSLNQE